MSFSATNDTSAQASLVLHPSWTVQKAIVAAATLLAGYSILNAWFLADLGIRISGDGPLYLSGAEDLRHGRPVQELLRSRFGYVCLIAVCQKTGLGLAGVVAIQILIAGIAMLALYELGRRLGGGPWVGVGAAAIFALNPDFVHWHCYILTDSLYISTVILATWAIHWAVQGKQGFSLRYVLAAAIVSLPPLLRPNGWLLVLIAACYWFASLQPRMSIRVAGMVLAGSAFVAGFFLLLTLKPGLLTNSPDTMLRQGEVVWGYSASRLPMPMDEADEGGLLGAAGYVMRHPLACAHLGAVRVLTELAHARPYYSVRHNAVCLMVVLPIYFLALYGFLSRRKHTLAWLLALTIAAHLMIQAVNYADWSGRFLLYVFPLCGVLASAGFIALCAKLQPLGRL